METRCLVVWKVPGDPTIYVASDAMPASQADKVATDRAKEFSSLNYGVLPIDDSAITWIKPQAVSP